ncbi:hypothetical protein IFM89_036624 [Coptis chinensis]|uniref:Pentatricopeptide repeat-containing protein n=1 Tax=Coptis chinensis TaxID=261450 RepID=A0A835HGK5_9MAGN|nr:hypothetical protein IFM89_036624 [Coptis chinensis]
MGKRDVVTWTAMLGGYAQRGYYEEAVRIFQEMLQGGEVQPNEATLVNVLHVCASLGDLSLGKRVHSYMDSRDNVEFCFFAGLKATTKDSSSPSRKGKDSSSMD